MEVNVCNYPHIEFCAAAQRCQVEESFFSGEKNDNQSQSFQVTFKHLSIIGLKKETREQIFSPGCLSRRMSDIEYIMKKRTKNHFWTHLFCICFITSMCLLIYSVTWYFWTQLFIKVISKMFKWMIFLKHSIENNLIVLSQH